MADGYVKVAALDELPHGKLRSVKVGETEVCLLNTGDTVIAVSNLCTHAGCRLSVHGEVDGDELECGCHGSRFRLPTGEVTAPPARTPPQRFDVRIERRDVFVSASS